jgi:hypothetical protein
MSLMVFSLSFRLCFAVAFLYGSEDVCTVRGRRGGLLRLATCLIKVSALLVMLTVWRILESLETHKEILSWVTQGAKAIIMRTTHDEN